MGRASVLNQFNGRQPIRYAVRVVSRARRTIVTLVFLGVSLLAVLLFVGLSRPPSTSVLQVLDTLTLYAFAPFLIS